MADATSPEEQQEILLGFLSGEVKASYLTISSLALLLYEYFITFDEEVKCFWTGSWTISRVLFLANRYLILIVSVLTNLTFFTKNPSDDFCLQTIKASFAIGGVTLLVVQAILTIRVWYLFSGNQRLRTFILFAYISTTLASITLLSLNLSSIALSQDLSLPSVPSPADGPDSDSDATTSTQIPIPSVGCKPPHINRVWRMFLPSFVLHTILYVLTVVRVLTCKEPLRKTPLVEKVLRDGGLFYIVVLISIVYTEIGAFDNTPVLYLTAVYSSFTVTVISISVSRIMLSITSLAAKLRLQPEWLLNHFELSHMNWRVGATEREILVDIETAEPEDTDTNFWNE